MIHTFQTQGFSIALDTYSGAVHLLDDITFDVVALLERWEQNGVLQPEDLRAESARGLSSSLRARLHEAFFSSEGVAPDPAKKRAAALSATEWNEILTDLDTLIADGQLFTEDTFGHLSLDLRERKTYVKALCMNVAHTCNLDCDYCFASQGKYHGERSLMSTEVAERAIDFVISASGPHRNIDIDFFGGEPALNWDLVKHTVSYAREREKEAKKQFRFTYTTNGLLLTDEMIAFLNQNMHNVVLSLDGRPEIHDRLRHTISGQGSYAHILPHFKRFVSIRGDQEYYMRGTYTKNNTDFSEDVFHMANLGFYRLSMEPVIGDPSEPYMLGSEDVAVLNEQYDRITTEMIRRNRLAADQKAAGGSIEDLPPQDHPFLFYHFMMNLEGGPCIHKRISGCGSGSEYLAVTPTGELYPCHQFVGETGYQVGTVTEGITTPELIGDFKECNCYSRPGCQSCWAKLYCSGGCAANALHASGSLKGTVPFSCDLFRKRMECALAIKADEAMYDPTAKHHASSKRS